MRHFYLLLFLLSCATKASSQERWIGIGTGVTITRPTGVNDTGLTLKRSAARGVFSLSYIKLNEKRRISEIGFSIRQRGLFADKFAFSEQTLRSTQNWLYGDLRYGWTIPLPDELMESALLIGVSGGYMFYQSAKLHTWDDHVIKGKDLILHAPSRLNADFSIGTKISYQFAETMTGVASFYLAAPLYDCWTINENIHSYYCELKVSFHYLLL